MIRYLAAIGICCLLLFPPQSGKAQQNLDLVGYLPYAAELSNIWGYVAPGGREYAVVGTFEGVSIVDLQDPENPVEVVFIPGPKSIWRELKVWGDHAYVTNETGGGLAIIDLGNLPLSADTTSYRGRGLWTAHTLFIDSNGVAYVYGANIDNGGATMLDLTVDPESPVFLGAYTNRYVHDGFVRGDTLWAAEIKVGEFSVVDVSNKAAPVVLGSQKTPIGLTHNSWLSDDGATLAISEEYPAGNIVTYDVRDPSDINELGRFRSNWETNIIPHNVYYLSDWLVTSYYRDGVTLTDASRPNNLVGTGFFDTSPFSSDGEFNGCWGVYPYLPSGLILASDIEEGLFILRPQYKRAAYLEGTVRESLTGIPRIYSRVEIMGTNARQFITDFTGEFRTGTADSGLFTVRVTASGCATALYPGIELIPGQVTILDAGLECTGTAVPDISVPEAWAAVQPVVFGESTVLSWDFGSRWNEEARWECLDAAGRVLCRGRMNQPAGSEVLGADFPDGFYLIRATSGFENWILKAIRR